MRKAKYALIRFYSEFDTYLKAVLKFVLAFSLFSSICALPGEAGIFELLTIRLMFSAFCAILPANGLVLIAAIFVEAKFWGGTLVSGLAGGVVLFVFLLFYFSFIPEQGYIVAVTALFLGLKVPLAVPVVCGLLCGPGTLAGIIFGTAAYYGTVSLGLWEPGSQVLGTELADEFLTLIMSFWKNQEAAFMLVILTAVFLVVYLIRRLPVRYSWSLAILSGTVSYGLLRGMEALFLKGSVSLVLFLLDLLAGAAAGLAVQFFAFDLDYEKVQHLQFEDDDYYYYVKAIPKMEAVMQKKGDEGS